MCLCDIFWPRCATATQEVKTDTYVMSCVCVCLFRPILCGRCSFLKQESELFPHVMYSHMHTYTLLSCAAVFPINFSSQSSPTSACHRPAPLPLNSATQDQSRSHVSVTLTPAPPAFGDWLVNMPTPAFYVSNKGRADTAPGDQYLIMYIKAWGGTLNV